MKAWLPNLVGFQIVWFSAVAGAAYGLWWAGPLAAALFAAAQLAVSSQRGSDLRLLALCLPLGFAVDSAWVQAGWLVFATPFPWPQLAPVWIVAMWAGFALTINHSMASLKAWPWAAALLGLLGGPLAYYAAARAWDAVDIAAGIAPYLALGIAWAVITPLLLWLGERWSLAARVRAAA